MNFVSGQLFWLDYLICFSPKNQRDWDPPMEGVRRTCITQGVRVKIATNLRGFRILRVVYNIIDESWVKVFMATFATPPVGGNKKTLNWCKVGPEPIVINASYNLYKWPEING